MFTAVTMTVGGGGARATGARDLSLAGKLKHSVIIFISRALRRRRYRPMIPTVHDCTKNTNTKKIPDVPNNKLWSCLCKLEMNNRDRFADFGNLQQKRLTKNYGS